MNIKYFLAVSLIVSLFASTGFNTITTKANVFDNIFNDTSFNLGNIFSNWGSGGFNLPDSSNYSDSSQNLDTQDNSGLYSLFSDTFSDSNSGFTESSSHSSDELGFQSMYGNSKTPQPRQISSDKCILNATPTQERLIKEAVKKAAQLNYVLRTCLQPNPKIHIAVINDDKINAFVSGLYPNVIIITSGMLDAAATGSIMKIRTSNGIQTASVRSMLPCVLIHEKSHTDQYTSISKKGYYNYLDVGVTFDPPKADNQGKMIVIDQQKENDAIQREQNCERYFGLPVRVNYSTETAQAPSNSLAFGDMGIDNSFGSSNFGNMNTSDDFFEIE
jgi:Peptidase family M48